MPVNFQGLGILLGQDLKIGILFERPSEINQIAVRLGREGGVS